MTYNTNVYDPDNLIEGAAMIYIVSASMTHIPEEVFDGLMEDPEQLKAMLRMYSQVLIKGMIEMGFDHDDVKNRAEEMVQENEDERELEELDEKARNILSSVILDDDTEN
tara:strand:+ start:21 stop:350 length:330 start_codon:yes stop_codon:yes gene_type:complete